MRADSSRYTNIYKGHERNDMKTTTTNGPKTLLSTSSLSAAVNIDETHATQHIYAKYKETNTRKICTLASSVCSVYTINHLEILSLG